MAEGTGWREVVRRRFRVETFDVAIVGGGITGAGIARDASLRGLRVALLEAHDFASGTSSRSSRLVHGGVRYLEHGHLHLVFESSRERRILLRIAPHLVRPLAFTWPVYRGARVSRMRLALGLGLYDALSMFRNVARHERLSRREVLEREPQLRPDDLVGGARYYDAATDDSRLTLANVVSAVEAGAAVLNHAPVSGFEMAGGRAQGLRARDAIGGDEFTVRASTIVNATGPWSDDVRALEAPTDRRSVAGSRGAHIAVPRVRIGNRDAITMLHPADGRVLFTLPAGDQAIIGTTETPTAPGDRESQASGEDVAYLLSGANASFPNAALTAADVVSAWSGIRPLAQQLATGDVGSASREHTIARGPRGVLHVTGGKLTTYREMASQVVDMFAGPEAAKERTAIVALPGGDQPLENARRDAMEVDDAAVRERLVLSYGSRWRSVWALGAEAPALRERLSPAHTVIAAEMVHGVTREMAMTLGDLLIRRTHLAFESPDQARSVAPKVAELVTPLLGWTNRDRDGALRHYDEEVRRTFSVTDT
ncbi:MAG TPA: glycerol-3-phosphate dehydrogenase/oxidase [Gemmatimonadaceae bacterium]